MKDVILFVDDEPAVTRAIRRLLREPDMEVLTANSAREALEILAARQVDVVVSDEKMPEMCGSEFLVRVRESYPRTVRMILSGHADLEAAVAAINDAEIYRFLLKPCPPEVLRSAVRAAFDSFRFRHKIRSWQNEHETEPDQRRQRFEQALALTYPVFQPIVDARSGVIVAFEALCRVADPDFGGPSELFDLAERTELEVETDRYLRGLVAARLSEFPPGVRCFVNLHPRSLLDDGFVFGTDPLKPFADRVVLEITERSSTAGLVDLEERILALRSQGYGIALDDLGAGYAGLTSFARMRPDLVKFDMQLVRGVDTDPVRRSMLETLSALCDTMGVESVAEGIETHGEADCVRELGATYMQGFLLGRPQRDPVATGRRAA